VPRIISAQTCDFLSKYSRNLYNASQSGDPDLAEATLLSLKKELDYFIEDLQKGKK